MDRTSGRGNLPVAVAHWAPLAGLLALLAACAEGAPAAPAPRAVAVAAAPARGSAEALAPRATAPLPGQAAEEDAPADAGEEAEEPAWVKSLRAVCKEIDKPAQVERGTVGADPWKEKLSLQVRDLRVFSPMVGRWSLSAVGTDRMVQSVRNRRGLFGIGMTVEVENRSAEVLTGDDVYLWATFRSDAGEQLCFASARDSRSWDPFAGKAGTGDWVTDRDASERALRPGERKRYLVYADDCLSPLFLETEPAGVTLEAYVRFRTLANDLVIVGPLATFERPGGLLRGLPVAAAARDVARLTSRGSEPARALYMAGDQVLIAQDRATTWVPQHDLAGVRPDRPVALDELPATTPDYSRAFGALTVQIGGWKVAPWHALGGDVDKGHRRLTADVTIEVDTAAVRGALEKAVADARAGVQEAQARVEETTAAAAAAAEAEMAAKVAKEGDGFAAAKEAAAAAKTAAKDAAKELKAAEGELKKAEKALASGVKAFLKEQAKAIDCGSFRLDVARTALRPEKGSIDAKACKPLLDGAAVLSTVSFDLTRWDAPLLLSWSGSGALRTYPVASASLAAIPRE